MIFNKILTAMIQDDKLAHANIASHPLTQKTKKLKVDSRHLKQQPRKEINASERVSSQSSLYMLTSSTQSKNQPRQHSTNATTKTSASRVIWNALAITSMVTLIGFGLLSLKLSRDLNQAQADLNAIQEPIMADESLLAAQHSVRSATPKQLSKNQSQTTTIEKQHAALQAKYQTVEEERNRIARLNASLVKENNRLANLRSIEQQRTALVGAANQALFLFGPEATSSLQGALYMKDYKGLLVLHGLEVLATDQAYQLWLFTEHGVQIPASLITVQNSHNPIWTEVELSPNMPNFIAASISIEPSSGSISPTGPMVLSSKIDS